jgi:phosphatidate cytidylyltransferase
VADEGREDREGREDLFEDLDKFFAPIQDVDWPETVEPTEGEAAAPPTAPGAEPSSSESLFGEREPEPAAAEPPVGAPRAEEPPAETEEPGPREEPEEEPGREAEEEGIEAFLFEGEEPEAEEEDVGSAIAAERERPPAAYVDLPTPEPLEEPEEAPSEEALEAAAEHFAASVREEVVLEPAEPSDTEPEAGLEELLGGEEEVAEQAPPVRTVRVGGEGLGGPSWQEPTAVEVGPDLMHRGPGRNVQLAFATGILLAALAVAAIAIGEVPFAVLAGLIVLVAQGELYFALQKRHYQPATALGLVAGALVLAAAYLRGEAAMLAVAALGIFASFLWYMTVPETHRRNVASNIGLTVLGIVWIPLLAGYALALLQHPDGRALVLSALGLTVAYDVSAFAVGYFWGSRPLAATISPKKSWEGAIGASLVVVALAIGVVAPAVDLLETIPRAVGLALVVAVFAPLGDLAESLVKRDLQIKDMGGILPGHGGVLDRIDAMLFVAPAAFLYLRLILS